MLTVLKNEQNKAVLDATRKTSSIKLIMNFVLLIFFILLWLWILINNESLELTMGPSLSPELQFALFGKRSAVPT